MKRYLVCFMVVLVVVSFLAGCSQATPTTSAPTSAPTSTLPTTSAATTSPPTTSAPTSPPASTTATPAAKTVELTFNIAAPGKAQASVYEPSERLVQKVAERTNGRVKIVMMYNAALAPLPETFDAVLKGITDIGESNTGYSAGRFPITEATILPFGFPSSFAQSHTINDFVNKYSLSEFEGVVPMDFVTPPPFVLGMTKTPVRTIDDMNGKIIRVTSQSAADLITKMGATPRVTPITEVYELLAKGVIDGQTSGPEAWPGFKFTEVCNYMVDIRFIAMGNVSYTIINKDSWAKLTPQDQQTLKEIFQEQVNDRSLTWDYYNDKAAEDYKNMSGKEFITIADQDQEPFKAAANSIIEAYVQDMTAKGQPAAEWIQYIRDRIDYWPSQEAAAKTQWQEWVQKYPVQ